jgi:hypothetical protein
VRGDLVDFLRFNAILEIDDGGDNFFLAGVEASCGVDGQICRSVEGVTGAARRSAPSRARLTEAIMVRRAGNKHETGFIHRLREISTRKRIH